VRWRCRDAGGITQVGAAEKAGIEQLGVRVIDASQAGWGINHDLFLRSDLLNSRLKELREPA
jgi:hypothetical protein